MTRANAKFHAAIFGLPEGIDDNVQGGVNHFDTKADLNTWIEAEKVKPHTVDKFAEQGYGILPDGRAVQIFHGHTESLVTKVEIG